MAITKATASSVAPAAKGDLVVGSGTNDAAVLGVGSANQVLTVDSSTGTGLKWAAPASGVTFAGCYLYNSTNTTAANNTYTLLNFDSELYDTDGFHSTSSNTSRITIPSGKAGYYLIIGSIMYFDARNTTGIRASAPTINGSGISYVTAAPGSAGQYDGQSITYVGIRNLAVGDYVELQAYQTSGGTFTINRAADNTWLSVAYLGA